MSLSLDLHENSRVVALATVVVAVAEEHVGRVGRGQAAVDDAGVQATDGHCADSGHVSVLGAPGLPLVVAAPAVHELGLVVHDAAVPQQRLHLRDEVHVSRHYFRRRQGTQ